MNDFSYTITPFFNKQLEEIEIQRQKILLTMVSPKDEIRLRWETTINRIYYSFLIRKESLRKSEIIELLNPEGKKNLTSKQRQIIVYKKAYDYLIQKWTINSSSINTETVKYLAEILLIDSSSLSGVNVKNFLSFIQINPEHPIVQAALAYILIIQNLPEKEGNEQLAGLLSMLILYKNGYDFRGLVNLEEYFFHDQITYRQNLLDNIKNTNISSFIEYYILAMESQVKKAVTKLSERNFEISYPSDFFKITERQQAILALLDQPGLRLTNKKIQSAFKVSQITSSRDLAKLASLGLIFPFGKGRSTYYTKV
jgi:hypothetical protein